MECGIYQSLLNDSNSEVGLMSLDKRLSPGPITRRPNRLQLTPEQRALNRRMKKVTIERRRRACISDKMNHLQKLALNLIGDDPERYQKIEKADILSLCCDIISKIAILIQNYPGIRTELAKLRIEIQQQYGHSLSDSQKTSPIHFRRTVLTESNLFQSEANKENFSNITPTSVSKPRNSAFSVVTRRTQENYCTNFESLHSTPITKHSAHWNSIEDSGFNDSSSPFIRTKPYTSDSITQFHLKPLENSKSSNSKISPYLNAKIGAGEDPLWRPYID